MSAAISRSSRNNFFSDVLAVSVRAIRGIRRDPETVIPSLIIPAFFFFVNLGSLQSFTEKSFQDFDFAAFQVPVGIVFAVTGISRAPALVTDIQNGYFDRLAMTPVRRSALLLGLMIADFLLIVALSIPVVILGFIVGVTFTTGLLGILAFLLIAGLWGLAFTGFAYAIALKTGNPAAVNTSFLLFFPFTFLTTSFLPLEALSGWLRVFARFNPVTYLLAGLRSLITEGWDGEALGKALLAIAIVAVFSFSLAFWALRSRVSRA